MLGDQYQKSVTCMYPVTRIPDTGYRKYHHVPETGPCTWLFTTMWTVPCVLYAGNSDKWNVSYTTPLPRERRVPVQQNTHRLERKQKETHSQNYLVLSTEGKARVPGC